MPRSGWLAVGVVGGALVGPGTLPASEALVAIAGSVAAVVIAALLSRARPIATARRRAAPSALLLSVGMLAVVLRMAVGTSLEPPSAVLVPEGRGPWTATVEAIGAPHDGQQSATIRLETEGGPRVAATLPRYPAVAPGDRVAVGGALRLPPADEYGRYLERIGAVATLRAVSLELEPASAGPGAALEALRRASADGLATVLPEPEAGLAAGILVGLRDRVDRDLAAAFTTAGVSHVVAISGWNIAIVGAMVAALARRWRRRRRAIVTALAIVGYTAFAGASPSVVRAALMAGVVLLARESGRAGTAAAALGWAVAILILFDPRLVADPGLQLSALATAGLIAWATPLTARLTRAGRGRLPGWLTEGLGVSLAAQAATLPVVLLVFGRLAIVAPAVNLAVVPLVPPAMAAGALALGAGWLASSGGPAPIATLLGLPAWLLLTAMVRIVELSASLPFASVTLEPPLTIVAALLSLAPVGLAVGIRKAPWLRSLGMAIGRRRQAAGAGPAPRPAGRGRPGSRRWQRVAAITLGGAVLCLSLVAASRPDGRTRIVVLDVGQGDAILVEGARGGRLLVDGGPDPDRLLVALDARLPPWDRRLDVVVLTHPHEDHAAGLPLLLGRYRIGRLFEPGMRGPGPGYRAFARQLVAGGRSIGRLFTGDRLTLDDIRFRVLWPDAGRVPDRPPDTGTGINNVSIVLLGDVGGHRFLLSGDIEEGIDPILVGRGLPHVDLLKVAHHGSRTASTDAFLAAVLPTVAIISVGAKNTYGHPSRATIGRLEAHGARVFRTDRNGSTEVAFDGARLLVRPDLDPPVAAAVAPVVIASEAGTYVRASFGCLIVRRGTVAATTLLYHRTDVGARADRSSRPPSLPSTPDLVPPPLAGRGGDRGLARAADRSRRDPGRSSARRVGRSASRRRQAAAADRSGERAPPR